jgi:hypothetical protein
MRRLLTKHGLDSLMREIARRAPRGRHFRVFIVGGGTAVCLGWRPSSIDADLCADNDDVFANIQAIKEELQLNIEFARPEHFVPPLPGSDDRHIFISTLSHVSFFHYDPYSQLLAKVVRGFNRDLADAGKFIDSGLVDPARFRSLVDQIPESAYAKYPTLSPLAISNAVGDFLKSRRT